MDFEDRILNFRNKYEILMEHTDIVLPDNVKASVTWKVHCIVNHLPEFLRKVKTGMSIYSEQTVEACHSDFKKTFKRFKVKESHKNHGNRLKRAVVEYNSRRLLARKLPNLLKAFAYSVFHI